MRIRSLVGAIVLTGAALSGPALLPSAVNTQAQDFCKDWFIVGDVCEAVDYCWETNDPACDQMGNEPSIAPRQGTGY